MTKKKPMVRLFNYFGAKWRDASKYSFPICDTIIEPFAGSAGYAGRYCHKKVILVEKDPPAQWLPFKRLFLNRGAYRARNEVVWEGW